MKTVFYDFGDETIVNIAHITRVVKATPTEAAYAVMSDGSQFFMKPDEYKQFVRTLNRLHGREELVFI